MENEIDLTGVDPARWPEIRRRVAILDEYVKLWRPAEEVRKEYAKRMGVALSTFMAIARIWRENRSASAIPGARARNSLPTARRIDPMSVEIMQQAIADIGLSSRRVDVLKEVERRCIAAGVAKPSNSTITNLLDKMRAAANATTEFAPEILIDECAVKLPAVHGGDIYMPHVLVAVALPQGTIVAADIGDGPDDPPSVARLAERLEAAFPGTGVGLPIRAPHLDPMERAVVGATDAANPTLRRVLGAQLDGLGLVYQESKARPTTALVRSRNSSTLSKDDVHRAIWSAIEAHNAARPALPGFASVGADSGFTPAGR